ncbi:MAG: hypothetical protein MK185_05350 [Saccharospirillaceae bacterium]|nr:hypothetical protein [Saccharospirillaceae bacterium]
MLNKLVEGFLWGTGFALSSAGIYVAFLMYTAAGIDYAIKKESKEIREMALKEMEAGVTFDVISSTVVDKKVFVGMKAEGTLAGPMTSQIFNAKLVLFSEGNLAGVCYSSLDSQIGSGEKDIYLQGSCRPIFYPAEDVDEVKAIPVWLGLENL